MKLYFVFVLGFLGIGVLLLSGHWGIAIKITNYIFYVLIFITTWKFVHNEKN